MYTCDNRYNRTHSGESVSRKRFGNINLQRKQHLRLAQLEAASLSFDVGDATPEAAFQTQLHDIDESTIQAAKAIATNAKAATAARNSKCNNNSKTESGVNTSIGESCSSSSRGCETARRDGSRAGADEYTGCS